MNAAFLVAYIAVLAAAYWRVRSLAWLVLTTAGSIAVFGAGLNFLHDRAIRLTGLQLQWILLGALVVVLVAAFLQSYRGSISIRRQLLAVVVPAVVLIAFFVLVTTSWTEELAFLRPVSFLMGNGFAEDNSRWLDFASQWSSGSGIYQPVPLGGPLQLFLTFVGTVMGLVSEVVLGGVNQVAVAANSVIYGEYLLALMAPVSLAALAEAKFRSPLTVGVVRRGAVLPIPALWLGMGVLVVFSLASIRYGHLTLQFTFLIAGLWSATFLAQSKVPRARLISSLAAAASMTVWLPLNVIAVMVIVAWAVLYASRLVRFGPRSVDWVGVGLLAVVSVGVFQPVYSSLYYLLIGSQAFAVPGAVLNAAAGSVVASGSVPGLADSILFAATGGTEQVGPILAVLTAASVVAAAVVVSWQPSGNRFAGYRRFAPLGAFTFIAIFIYILDLWSTGSGPHYGSMKFSYLVAGIALATTLPLALMALTPDRIRVMTMPRWVALAAVVMIMAIDTLLPRAGAMLRPDQWSPPIPFNNPKSYWWPADVNGTAMQPISVNPVACLYLPEGSAVPTAIVPSGLSDPQRVYACTRQLAGLAGLDAEAQPIVDWLRREWFTNQPAWSAVYDTLAGLPDTVLDRPVILLDDGSNVKGIETLRTLLARYPKELSPT